MLYTFGANSANEVWFDALQQIKAVNKIQEGRDQETLEITHAVLSISDPRQRFVFYRPINIAFALAEVIWIMHGSDRLDDLTFWNPRMKNYSDDNVKLAGAYGYRLRKSIGIDQLEYAYNTLKANPNSRQVVLQIWNGFRDLANGAEVMSKDIPCNIVSHLMVRDGKLEWLQVMRSNDIIWGLPYNFIQWTMIMEFMASWLKVGLGDYVHVSDSLHIYKRHWDHVKEIAVEQIQCSENTDVINDTIEDTEFCINVLYYYMLKLADEALDYSDIGNLYLSKLDELNEFKYAQNILAVLTTEACRIRNFIEPNKLMYALINYCDNPAYITSYRNWLNSKHQTGA